MPTIDTLVQDIEAVLVEQRPIVPLSHEGWAESAWSMVKAIAPRPPTPGFVRGERVLYPSELGEECLRKLWYKIRAKDGKLAPADAMKFAYGHLLEEVLLTYAALAGHTIESRQTKLVSHVLSADGAPWQIRGKIDAVIDGVIVDVKTCSPRMYSDLSGYHRQVQWYSSAWPVPTGDPPPRAGLLAMNKTNGRLRFEEVPPTRGAYIGPHPSDLDELDGPEPPDRPYTPGITTFGQTLPDACIFCPFKFDCWPGLRAFKYSFGPEFFVRVDKMPRVRELTREEVERAPIRG